MNVTPSFAEVLVAISLSISAALLTDCSPSPSTPAAPAAAPANVPPPAAEAVQPAPAIAGFVHDPAHDVFGYYIPSPELRVDDWRLADIALGGTNEFVEFEKGAREPPTYAPFMLEFDDTSSPQTENEMGNMAYTRSARVLPTAYVVSGSRVAFAGTDPALGDVTFTGTLNLTALATAQNSGSSGDAIVLTGNLTIGGKTIKNVKFTWFAGD